MALPPTWFYRHDHHHTPRPYAIDVDADDWLWEGGGPARLQGHNLRTAATRDLHLPEAGRKTVYSVFAYGQQLVLTLGDAPWLLLIDRRDFTVTRLPLPIDKPIVWYGVKLPDKLVLFERTTSTALFYDPADMARPPRQVACPYPGQLAAGTLASDGLIYNVLTEPTRLIRLDPHAEAFIDEAACPSPDIGLSGKFCHDGVMYMADSAGGRILPMDLATQQWLEPIAVPGYRETFGFIGAGFGFQNRGYFCLSTYAHQSRLDPKTRKIIIPDGPVTIDGKPPRFLEKLLSFEPASQSFAYLESPTQPDGKPQMCYSWTDGQRFAVTGCMILQSTPGELQSEGGGWLVMQNHEAAEEPGFGPYDFRWDRAAHIRQYTRAHTPRYSHYLSMPPHSPPLDNQAGPDWQFPPGTVDMLNRRAAKTDTTRYWQDLLDTVIADCDSDAQRVHRISAFLEQALYYNPVQAPDDASPIGALESHDGRCGVTARIAMTLFELAGIEARSRGLHHHVVAEAKYDNAWHMVDASIFGSQPPQRDGVVCSVDDLLAEPYFADGFPLPRFNFAPETLTTSDGYQLLGYCFGPWGSYPYYSWYLRAEADYPPTVPTCLPAKRIGDQRVQLNWSRSVKRGDDAIDYHVQVFADRAGTELVFECETADTSVAFDVPKANWMYHLHVRARDGHRRFNTDTWYPSGQWNFAITPPERYGWYGLV